MISIIKTEDKCKGPFKRPTMMRPPAKTNTARKKVTTTEPLMTADQYIQWLISR